MRSFGNIPQLSASFIQWSIQILIATSGNSECRDTRLGLKARSRELCFIKRRTRCRFFIDKKSNFT